MTLWVGRCGAARRGLSRGGEPGRKGNAGTGCAVEVDPRKVLERDELLAGDFVASPG